MFAEDLQQQSLVKNTDSRVPLQTFWFRIFGNKAKSLKFSRCSPGYSEVHPVLGTVVWDIWPNSFGRERTSVYIPEIFTAKFEDVQEPKPAKGILPKTQ